MHAYVHTPIQTFPGLRFPSAFCLHDYYLFLQTHRKGTSNKRTEIEGVLAEWGEGGKTTLYKKNSFLWNGQPDMQT